MAGMREYLPQQNSQDAVFIINLFIMEWEYKTIDLKLIEKTALTEQLNDLGSKGWEVISYIEKPPEKFGGEWRFSVLLKKQKSTKQIL